MLLTSLFAFIYGLGQKIYKLTIVGTLLVSLFSCGSANNEAITNETSGFVAEPSINLLKVNDDYYYYVGTLNPDKDIKEDITTTFKSGTNTITVYSTSKALYPGIVVVNIREVIDSKDYVYVSSKGMDVDCKLIDNFPPTDDEMYEGNIIEYNDKKYYFYCSTSNKFSDVGQELFEIDDVKYYQIKNKSGWVCTPNTSNPDIYDLYFEGTIKKIPIDYIAYTAYGLKQ